MSTSSSKHDPVGSVIPTTRTQLLTVKNVIDTLRISRPSGLSPKARTRRPLPATARAGYNAARSGFPDVVCWCPEKWFGKTLPDHRGDRGDFVRNSSAELINPTAIARTYSSTESIPGTATHRLRTSSPCVPSPNASPRKAEYDKALLAAGPPGAQQISATGRQGHQP
jgi:hypothetical protein